MSDINWTWRSFGLGYMNVAYGLNYTLFYLLHIGKVFSVLRPFG